MSAAIRPIVHDIVIVGDLDIVEIHGTELSHPGNQEIGVALPADAASIGRTSLSLERVPLPGLIRRDHEGRVDPGKHIAGRTGSATERAFRPQRLPAQNRAGSRAGGALKEIPPRLPPFAHGALTSAQRFGQRRIICDGLPSHPHLYVYGNRDSPSAPDTAASPSMVELSASRCAAVGRDCRKAAGPVVPLAAPASPSRFRSWVDSGHAVTSLELVLLDP